MSFYKSSNDPLRLYYIQNPKYLSELKTIFFKCYTQLHKSHQEISKIEMQDHTNIDNLTNTVNPSLLLSKKFEYLQRFLIENLNKIREIISEENKNKFLVKIPVEILEHLSKSDDISKIFKNIKNDEIQTENEKKDVDIRFKEVIKKLETMNFF